MKRTVRIYKPDVCNGDVAGEWEYELYDLHCGGGIGGLSALPLGDRHYRAES